jgi:hypothetical protein
MNMRRQCFSLVIEQDGLRLVLQNRPNRTNTPSDRSQHDNAASQQHAVDGPSFIDSKGSKPARQRQESHLERMRKQLHGGRFRMLNEQLYAVSGADALQLMQVRSQAVTHPVFGDKKATRKDMKRKEMEC